MKNYLSFGGGVNSVALHLYLLDQGWDFESVFVNHGTDWPETYEYLDMFQEWLDKRGINQITELKPNVKRGGKIYNNLYQCCIERLIKPHYGKNRWCTLAFKSEPLDKYQQEPCFVLLGIDAGEAHRATISVKGGREYRYPLVENDIGREGCKEIISSYNLPIPMKSGCFICPYQGYSGWKTLRVEHPDLFCEAERLENLFIDNRIKQGKKPLHLSVYQKRLRAVVEENQMKLWKQDEYPPCECML